MRRIYLDHNATTPILPEAQDAMLPYLGEMFGNPSSLHWAGKGAGDALNAARAQIAGLINADISEIVFTSCGSEGDNHAIKGVLQGNKKGRHMITTAIEHPAVYTTCMHLEQFGFEFTFVPVDSNGRPDPDDIKKAIRPDTVLISVMLANNETGVILPVKEIADITTEHGIIMHTDAVQAIGKLPVDVVDLGIDILSASGHKFNAPKGVGFQYIKKGTPLQPLITGGHQEHGHRAGTENIPSIVAMGKCAEIAKSHMGDKIKTLSSLRDRLEQAILNNVKNTAVNGADAERICNTSSIGFKNIEAEALMVMLQNAGIAVSTGSACSSKSGGTSRVLTAMGLDPLCSRGTVRFSMGYGNTDDDIEYCLSVLLPMAQKLQQMSPFA